MEFLNPTALYGLLVLPLLLIVYLIKGKPRRVVFSSLLLLRDFAARRLGRRWGRLVLPPIFFLQLLLLLLLVLALGQPVLSTRPLKMAIVLDNSASMQALEGRKSRFELAQESARDALDGLSTRAQIDVYLSVPRLARVGEEAMGPSGAVALIRRLHPYDLGEAAGSVDDGLPRLVKEKDYERLIFVTDRPLRGQSGVIKVITVGKPRDNLAITSLQLFHRSLVSSQLQAKVDVTSFSARQEKLKLSLKGGGKVLSSKAIVVGPGKVATTDFENLPAHPYYEAEIDADDALPLDNRRYAVPPPAGGLKILAVSPQPKSVLSLRAIPGVDLEVVGPDSYAKRAEKEHSLEIFHFAAPAQLPRHNALFILPPRDNPLAAEDKTLSRPAVSSWRDPHPLTRYVNFALLRPSYARTLKPLLAAESILKSPEGSLMLAFERQGYRYLVLGFDPLPFLGQQNLPVSILTLNVLDWFYAAQGTSGFATGAPIDLQNAAAGATLITPKQEKIQIKGSSRLFSQTLYQGLYQLVRRDGKDYLAVNLDSAGESDLNNPAPIDLKADSAAGESRSFLFPLWSYLLLLSILLLLLEWYFNPPVTQP